MSEHFPAQAPVSLGINPIDDRWYVSPKGQVVGAHDTGWQFYLKRNDFVPLKMREERTGNNIKNVCIISRPRGGFGDMLCIVPAIETFVVKHHSKYDKIVLRFPKLYRFLFEQVLIDYPTVRYVNHDKFRELDIKKYRTLYNVWCPAGLHEQRMQYRPVHSRVENFAELLGVPPRGMWYQPKIIMMIIGFVKLNLMLRKWRGKERRSPVSG